ncbi:MAG: hypothetical protein LR000_01895 [Candidatus Pacebacteria bacterium]|nr:hypothetical protein [Candidatus Paceibacterota bacterium]
MSRTLKIKEIVRITQTCIVAEKGKDITIPFPIGEVCMNLRNRTLLVVTGEKFANPHPLKVKFQGSKVIISLAGNAYSRMSEFLGNSSSVKAKITPWSKANSHLFVITPVQE